MTANPVSKTTLVLGPSGERIQASPLLPEHPLLGDLDRGSFPNQRRSIRSHITVPRQSKAPEELGAQPEMHGDEIAAFGSAGDQSRTHSFVETQPSTTIGAVSEDQSTSQVRQPIPDMPLFARVVAERVKEVSKLQGRGLFEWPRLKLLQEACIYADYAYLVLHQVFCSKHLLMPTKITEKQEKGFAVVVNMLASNADLSTNALEWFASFPMQLDQMLLFYPSTIKTAHEEVLSTLTTLAENWSDLRSACSKRHYPPLVDETKTILNVHSPVLQGVINRTILRDFWTGPADRCCQKMEEVFSEDQHEVIDRQHHRTDFPDARRNMYKKQVIDKYLGLWNAHLEHMKPSIQPPIQSLARAQPNFVSSHPLAPHHGQYPIPSNTLPTPSVAPPYRQHSTPSMRYHQQASHTVNGPLPRRKGSYAHSLFDLRKSSSPRDNRPVSMSSSGNGSLLAQQIMPPPGARWQSIGSPHAHAEYNQQTGLLITDDNATSDYSGSHTHRPGYLTQASGPHGSAFAIASRSRSECNSQCHPSSSTHQRSNSSDMFVRIPRQNSVDSLPLLPSPMRTALHQINAVSPELLPAASPKSSNCAELFQFIQRVFLPPRVLDAQQCYQQWAFSLEEEDVIHLATDSTQAFGWRPTRHIAHGTRTCRIRCLKWAHRQSLPSQNEWVVGEHSWPSPLTIILNEVALDLRRKSHHGKDMPLDITKYIKRDANHLRVAILGLPQDASERFVVAVEVIGTMDLWTLRAVIPMLNFHEARTRIIEQTKSLDKEIVVLDRQIIIDLTDPFSACLFDVPVRGASCRHPQCFDLEIFLGTRCADGNNREPCSPDSFRCPICGGDARPLSLIKDGFLIAVRDRLEKLDRMDVKAIILKETGDWDIKKDGEPSGETGDGTGRKKRMQPLKPNAVSSGDEVVSTAGGIGQREVIELD